MKRMYVNSTKRIQNGYHETVYYGYRINDQFGIYQEYDSRDYMTCGYWVTIHLATGSAVCTTESIKQALQALTHFDLSNFEHVMLNSRGYIEWPNQEIKQSMRDTWQSLKDQGIIVR